MSPMESPSSIVYKLVLSWVFGSLNSTTNGLDYESRAPQKRIKVYQLRFNLLIWSIIIQLRSEIWRKESQTNISEHFLCTGAILCFQPLAHDFNRWLNEFKAPVASTLAQNVNGYSSRMQWLQTSTVLCWSLESSQLYFNQKISESNFRQFKFKFCGLNHKNIDMKKFKIINHILIQSYIQYFNIIQNIPR